MHWELGKIEESDYSFGRVGKKQREAMERKLQEGAGKTEEEKEAKEKKEQEEWAKKREEEGRRQRELQQRQKTMLSLSFEKGDLIKAMEKKIEELKPYKWALSHRSGIMKTKMQDIVQKRQSEINTIKARIDSIVSQLKAMKADPIYYKDPVYYPN